MQTCEDSLKLPRPRAYPLREIAVIDPHGGLRLVTERHEKGPVRTSHPVNELGDIFYMVESRPRNPWAMAASYLTLSLVLLALVLYPLFHIDPLPKREKVTALYLPPRAAAVSSSVQIRAPRSAPTTKQSITIPVRVPTQAAETPVETTAGVVAGVPGGVVGGAPDGLLSDVLSGSGGVPKLVKATERTPVKRIRVASQVAEANLIQDVPPQYPPEAGRKRIEGTVVLMAVIGKDGSVEGVQVVSGLPMLAEAAIEAVKQWRYRPYLLNGEPVEIDSRITINFTLSRG